MARFENTFIRIAAPGVRFVVLPLCALAMFVSLLTTSAFAQLTTEKLIGHAVSDVGPRFSDIDEAIKRFGNKDVGNARRFLEIAVEKNPQLPPVDTLLGRLFLAARNSQGAHAAFESAIKQSPTDPEAYLLIAGQAIGNGRMTEAEAVYRMTGPLVESFKGYAKRKRYFTISMNEGSSLIAQRRGKYKQAILHLKKWLASDPESSSAHQQLGRAMFMDATTPEQYSAAIGEFQAAYKLEPKLTHPYVSAALMYHQKDNQDNARKYFARAAKEDSKNAKTMRAYALWQLETGNPGGAKVPIAAAIKLEPDSVDAYILGGIAARMSSDTKNAESYFKQAHDISPVNLNANNQLATLFVMDDKVSKRNRALQYAGMNSKLYPKSTEAAVTLAWVHYHLGQLREAQAALSQLGSLGNLDADSSYYVAKIQFDQNKPDVAKVLLQSALKKKGLFVHKKEATALLSKIGE